MLRTAEEQREITESPLQAQSAHYRGVSAIMAYDAAKGLKAPLRGAE